MLLYYSTHVLQMERLRKLLTVTLALLIGVWFVPGVGSTYNLIAMAGEAQGTIPVLPMGEELGDEELAAVEGVLVVELLGIYLAAKATLVLAKGAAAAAHTAYKKACFLTRGALLVAYRIAKGAERERAGRFGGHKARITRQ